MQSANTNAGKKLQDLQSKSRMEVTTQSTYKLETVLVNRPAHCKDEPVLVRERLLLLATAALERLHESAHPKENPKENEEGRKKDTSW